MNECKSVDFPEHFYALMAFIVIVVVVVVVVVGCVHQVCLNAKAINFVFACRTGERSL